MAEEPTAKEKGNKAFASGDYEAAIAAYTEAIATDPTDHALHSNRSAANAKKGAFKDALLDANKCIELKPDWAKGHSRRGAAYFGLQNWPAAQAAYEKSLELDPSSANAQKELEIIKRKRDPALRRAAQAQGGGGAPAGGLTSQLSLICLVSGALYMLPLLPKYATTFYKVCLGNILLIFALNLYNDFQLKFSTLSDPAFKARQESQAFMLCIFMLLTPPMPFALMPFLAIALLNVCYAYKDVAARLPGPLGSMLGPRMAFFTTEEGAFQVRSFGAVSEVVVAVMSPLLIVVQGARAAILGFFYFQYVVRRYRTNQFTQLAVSHFDERVGSMLSHRFAPAPLKMIFVRFKALIGKVAQYTVK
eukprot:CAMPEP_0174720684 /NCGR_PEP_ID=MMETSP1094-20130205/34191_1 /TAXON_ID=156173 /ORGANISM="Chrysochromulina brevifilum, Strain UTEX LB 985" /LENGTH=361 /DNA_ID=CAMNT_0015921209 /DNA_START=84 /DNA_END=1169 /DNA_ORIENTATION=+